MRQEWSIDELVSVWTLVEADWTLVANKTGATRLGFAVLLKFFGIDARFPQHAGEVPIAAVAYVAEQVKVPAEQFATYSWSSRSIKYHREQVRGVFGFREFTRGDEDKLAGWLAQEVCPVELGDDALREALLVRCRTERIEPPGRIVCISGAARSVFERWFCQRTTSRLDEPTTARLLGLLAADTDVGRSGGDCWRS